jgi:hypothetical protein
MNPFFNRFPLISLFLKLKIMKKLPYTALSIAFITLFSCCESASSEIKEMLAKPETKKEIMETIANNSDMSKQMMETMMNSPACKTMMQGNEKMSMMMMENQANMTATMKNNPSMMHNMMSNMMEACKNDSTMMSAMCKQMMDNPQMMEMMKTMKGKNMDMGKMNHDMKKSK